MPDIFSPAKRSDIMSRIRSKNTSLELRVFSDLRRLGFRFQKHYSKVPGKPDVAWPSKKVVVFIDGDFWHGWRYAKRKKKLTLFWRNKIENNMRRDQRNFRKLRRMGWRVVRVWEHQLAKDREKAMNKILEMLKPWKGRVVG